MSVYNLVDDPRPRSTKKPDNTYPLTNIDPLYNLESYRSAHADKPIVTENDIDMTTYTVGSPQKG